MNPFRFLVAPLLVSSLLAQGPPISRLLTPEERAAMRAQDNSVTIANVTIVLNGQATDIGDIQVQLIHRPANSPMRAVLLLDPKYAWLTACMDFHWAQIVTYSGHNPQPTYRNAAPSLPVVDSPADGWDYMYLDGAGRTRQDPQFTVFFDALPWYYNAIGEAAFSQVGQFYGMEDAPSNPPNGVVTFKTWMVGVVKGTTQMGLIAGFVWNATALLPAQIPPAELPPNNQAEADPVTTGLTNGQIAGWTVLPQCTVNCAQGGQGGVAPEPRRTGYYVPGLNPGTGGVPCSTVQQVCMVQMAMDPVGLMTTAMSVTGLAATRGGAGGRDLLTGKFDPLRGVFTPDTRAAALNSPGDETALTLHHSGLYAVFERPGSGVWLARRNGPNDAFFVMGQIGGLPDSLWYDAAMADLSGQMQLVFVNSYGSTIQMAPLDLGTRQIGPALPIVRGLRPGSIPRSPCPIVSRGGDLLGVSHFDKLGLESDHYLALDLDPTTPPVRFVDSAVGLGAGAVAGGSFFTVESMPLANPRVLGFDTVWWSGGQGRPGGPINVRLFAPAEGEPRYTGILALAPGFLTEPLPVPGWSGLLGIDPVGSIWLLAGLLDGRTGEAVLPLPVPADDALRGILVPGQSVFVDLYSNQLVLGNTAGIRVL